MAWNDFLNHKCDIYHLNTGAENVGYGLSNDKSISYNTEADEKDIRCHFHIKSGEYKITQNEPLNEYSARVKISLPLETDIRINDKIVSRETGFSYIVELPRKIQEHHFIVFAHREGTVKEAI